MKLIIIGAGPGGYETAVEAAARGLEVTLVSDGPLGGTCLNVGCIPTKTLCSFAAEGLRDLNAFQERKAAVVGNLQDGIRSLLKGVNVVCGKASFNSSGKVEVNSEVLEADAIIIATGSVPAELPIPGAQYCLNSTEMLDLREIPSRLCVIGGGVIGLEFASVFSALGSEVTVLEYCPQILPHFDTDVCKRLKASLVKRGISIELSAQVTEVSADHEVKYLKGGKEYSVQADAVLISVGRRPCIEGLGLDAALIAYDRKGIKVDKNFCTSVPGILAVGDVTGGIMLAHVASAQGRAALDHICGQNPGIDFAVVPASVFTVPELSTVGKTEEECKEQGIEYSVGKAFYRANGKAVSMGEVEGYCKVIAGKDGKLLGAQVLGAHSSDIIHEFAVLMNFGISVREASRVIHAHPTLSEIALDALRDASKRIL